MHDTYQSQSPEIALFAIGKVVLDLRITETGSVCKLYVDDKKKICSCMKNMPSIIDTDKSNHIISDLLAIIVYSHQQAKRHKATITHSFGVVQGADAPSALNEICISNLSYQFLIQEGIDYPSGGHCPSPPSATPCLSIHVGIPW